MLHICGSGICDSCNLNSYVRIVTLSLLLLKAATNQLDRKALLCVTQNKLTSTPGDNLPKHPDRPY